MNSKELYNHIVQFDIEARSLADSFLSAFKLESFSDPNINRIDRSGTFTKDGLEIKYRLHGTGVEFMYPGKIIDFDYWPFFVEISSFKLLRFIRSVNPEVNIDQSTCEKYISELIEQGYIQKAFVDNVDLGVYLLTNKRDIDNSLNP